MKVKVSFAIRVDADRHHNTFVCESCIAIKMEKHRAVVLVVCRVEASDIDDAAAQAVSEICSEKRRLPVIPHPNSLSVNGCYNVLKLFCKCSMEESGRHKQIR